MSQDKNKKKRFALPDGRHKLIVDFARESSHVELFDLLADPAERNDLSQEDPVRVDAMRQRLEALLKENRELASAIGQRASEAASDERGSVAPSPSVLSDEEAAALRAIGYVEE